MQASPVWRYRLFNRVLESNLEINLLQEFHGNVSHESPVVRIAVSSKPLEPRGELYIGGEGFPVSHFVGDTQDFAVLNNTGYVASISKDGLLVSVHPDSRGDAGSTPETARRVADTLVTAVLSRLPIQWGTPAIHGATLSTPHGTVVVVGQSGYGKSTLSQVFQRDFSWELLDDDTVLIDAEAPIPTLVPMGAAARIRADAAANLQIQGDKLRGYSGGKIAIPNIAQLGALANVGVAMPMAIVELSPAESDPILQVEVVDPVRAIPALWANVFTTDASREQSERRFRAAQLLAESRLVRATYQRGLHSPEALAQEIRARISSMA
jgi:hypothetical protein